MVTIKMEKKLGCIFFVVEIFLFLSLKGSKNRIFISDKFFTFGNARLMLRIICKTSLIHFYSVIYFFSLYTQNDSLVKLYY